MVQQPMPESAGATSPAKHTQFGLREVMLLIASVALVLAVGTQLEDAGLAWAIAVTILLVGAWWSYWTRTVAPVFLAMCLPILAIIITPAVQSRRASPQLVCRMQLLRIVLALNEYAVTNNGHFPPAYVADETGRPMHSWRVLILPYLDSGAQFVQYRLDEPWDSPHNLKIAQHIPQEFQCRRSQV